MVGTIKKLRRGPLWAGIITAALTFVLFFSGIRFILNSVPSVANILAYLAMAVIFGIVACALFMLRPRVAYYFFEGGLLVGFLFMLSMFNNGRDGWSDLAGLLTFFIFTAAGLAAGLLAQLIVYLIRRRNKG